MERILTSMYFADEAKTESTELDRVIYNSFGKFTHRKLQFHVIKKVIMDLQAKPADDKSKNVSLIQLPCGSGKSTCMPVAAKSIIKSGLAGKVIIACPSIYLKDVMLKNIEFIDET